MVKSLKNLCMGQISANLDETGIWKISIPSNIKEDLLHYLINHNSLTKQYRPMISYHLISSSLQHLNIYGSIQLNDYLLEQIGKSNCTLKTLRLIRCGKITDQGLAEALNYQTELELLELRVLIIDGSCLSKCRSTKLKKISLKECSNITNHNLENFICHLRNVEHLKLSGLSKISDSAICVIAQQLKDSLKVLDLSQCKDITDDALIALAEFCPNLVKLKLVSCMNITSKGLLVLNNACKQLEFLDLSFCTRLTVNENNGSKALLALKNLPVSIHTLMLDGLNTSFNEVEFITAMIALPNLRQLGLSGFSLLSDSLVRQLLSKIGSQLIRLDFCGFSNKITDDSLLSVAEYCTNLEDFGISLMKDLVGDPLITMFQDKARASKFKILRLANCIKLKYSVLLAICENCINLNSLEMSGIQILDDALIILLSENSLSLERLFIKAANLITDVSISVLASRCSFMRCLCLSGIPGVTDKSLFAVANHCHYLEELYLNGCTLISRSSKAYLEDNCIGRVVIYHIAPNFKEGEEVIAKNLDTGLYCRMKWPN